MLIGILSDSHGRHLAVRQAVALFDKLGVAQLIHCGDVGSPEVFDEMFGRPCAFVWGNMDAPQDGLLTYARSLGLPVPDETPLRLDLDGKRFAVFHGHEPGFSAALRQLDVDYILHGHTHVVCDEMLGGRRIINPGALYRAPRKTVATLDTRTDDLVFHEVHGA